MRFIILLLLTGSLFTGFLGENKKVMMLTQDNFNALWQKTDSLEKVGKYRSAWLVVDKIFNKAATEKNVNQQCKALYYQLKFSQRMEEEDQLKAIEQLESLSKTAYFPLKQICSSMLGDAYFGYYQSNRYRYLDRDPIAFDDEKDIRFWSLDKIISASYGAYEASLSEVKKLQQERSEDYKLILIEQDEWLFLRPTLYDLLAQKVLAFYQDSEISLNDPKEKIRFHDENYFLGVKEFNSRQFKEELSPLLEQKIIYLFQNLLKFHAEKNHLRALVDIDLQRLNFVYSQSDLENKQELYGSALLDLGKGVMENEAVTEVYHAQAQLLQEKASVPEEMQNAEVKTYLIQAVARCNQAEKEFPDSYGTQLCKNLKNTILQPSLNIETEKAGIPNNFQKALVSFKNLDFLYLKLIKIPDDYHLNDNNLTLEEEVKKLLSTKSVHDWLVDLKNPKDHFTYRTEIILPEVDKGYYALIASDDETFGNKKKLLTLGFLWSTELSYTFRPVGDGSNLIKVLNRNTGKPISKATVIVYDRNYEAPKNEYYLKQTALKTTDENGNVIVNSDSDYRNFVVRIQKGDDDFFPIDYLYSQRFQKSRSREIIHFFLDRAIYRPGQTVYFKALLTKKKDNEAEIIKNKKVDFSFRDVNYQEISTISLSTNAFGTVHGSFVIPAGGLTGTMTIQCSLGSKSFRVEEYKRPKFEVIHNPVEGSFKLNEQVTVLGKAKAYSSAAISDAKVSYRVIRKPHFIWYFDYYSPGFQTTEIAHGETQTNAEGEFEFSFKALGEIEKNNRWLNFYNFEVETTVTDISGETQTGTFNVAVGNNALLLSADIKDVVYADHPTQFKIFATNLNQQTVDSKGDVTLSRLKVPENVLKPRKWEVPNHWIIDENAFRNALPDDSYNVEMNPENFIVQNSIEQKFDTEKDSIISFENMRYWIPGLYKLQLKAIDAFGEEVVWEKYFKVIEEKQKENVFENPLFITIKENRLIPGSELELFLSSAWKDLPVTVEIEHDNKIVDCVEVVLNKSQKRLHFPVKNEYQGNFAVHISSARKNSFFQESHTITVPRVDQQLNLSFETFRSVLLPGAKEEWKIKVSPERGDILAAEMLAGMYDASLDQFVMENWVFDLFDSYYARLPWTSNAFSTTSSQAQLFNFYSYVNIQNKIYPYFNTFGYYAGAGNFQIRGARGEFQLMEMAEGAVMDDAVEITSYSQPLLSADKREMDSSGFEDQNNDEGKGENSGIQIRSNFNETAFFYPDLKTDPEGNVIFSFTLPEALTKWNFRAFAHTPELKFGFLNEEVIARKKLMVSPNLPRFIREGDVLQIRTKVDNLSEEDLEGFASIEILDASTMQPIADWLQDESTKPFSVKKGINTILAWELKAPSKTGAIALRVTAKAGNFSDGEENILPILTNRIFVTETEVFSLNKSGEQQLPLAMLEKAKQSNTLDPFALTLEYTPNPSWLVVKTLPYLMEYPYECAEQIYSRWYGNTLGRWIVKSKPEIKNVFEQWKNQPVALDSPLEKNQELKSLLIEETPWLNASKSESENQRRIAQFFDENQMTQAQLSAIRKMKQLQGAEGGWPWFKGMQSNRYITQHILTGIGHLKHLEIPLEDEDLINEMTLSALNYVDQELVKEFDLLKKRNLKYKDEKHAGAFHIQYLYMRSFFPKNPIPEFAKEAFSYYLNNSQKYWLDHNIYLEAMIALSAERNGNDPLAEMIMESLKERSIQDQERGMFWKNYQQGYYWYNPGTETHALMVEAFLEIKKDLEAVRQLKIWLLKNKQTNQWETTKATTEAVYAFLLNGADWLNSQPNFKIEIGGETFSSVDPAFAQEAGSGYFKKRWEGASITGKFNDLKIEKKDEVPSWGAVYWQYFENMDKVSVTANDAPVTITKTLFVERNTNQGPQLLPINEKEKINVGEKVIVRMKVTSEKDLEFVHLKDYRAAGFEPIDVLSGYRFKDGLGYYLSPRDAAMNFFIDQLPRGSFVLQYELRANVSGDFSNGMANIQCMYAPEFAGHSDGLRIEIEP